MAKMSPIGALLAGAAAGIAGSFAQNVYFRVTGRWRPTPARGAFQPPEQEQQDETETQTLARRAVEELAQRSPLSNKARAGRIVHYAYGAAWGGAYGLLAAPLRSDRCVRAGALFGLGVWAVSEGAVLPIFRLASWPTAYAPKVHAYSILAHLAYGVSVSAVFEALQRSPRRLILAGLGARWLTRRLPTPMGPIARRVTRPSVDWALRARAVADALQ